MDDTVEYSTNREGFTDIGNIIIQNQMSSILQVLDSFRESYSYTKGMIGERELRRVLADHLRLTNNQMDMFIENLRTQDQSSLFRVFSIDEVEQALTGITVPVDEN